MVRIHSGALGIKLLVRQRGIHDRTGGRIAAGSSREVARYGRTQAAWKPLKSLLETKCSMYAGEPTAAKSPQSFSVQKSAATSPKAMTVLSGVGCWEGLVSDRQ